jgi:hypothetical protein
MASSWTEALPLWFDSRNREYRGSIVDLTPGTRYEVTLTLRLSRTTARLQTATWSEAFPVGATVELPNGVSDKPYAVTRSGAVGRYLLFTPSRGGSATIDVAGRADHCLTIAASYVIVRGLTLKGAARDGLRLLEGAHHVVIEGCDISGWGSLRDPRRGWGTDGDSAIRARRVASLHEIVIQRNRLHHPRYTTNSWKDGHPEGPQGITIEYCGGHNVFRYNEIYGDDTHYFNDGICGATNFSNEGFPNYDADIYGNIVRHCMDDAIEVEGGDRNVRVWGNYLDHVQSGVASAACALGPLYIFRNIMAVSRWTPESGTSDEDERGPFGKLGDDRGFGGGRRYFFHNTILQPTRPGCRYPLGAGLGPADYGGPMTNTVSRNNIWHVFRPEAISISAGRSDGTNDLDYDLYNGRIKGAPGAEPHGMKGVPLYAPGNGPASGSGGRYHLAPASPGYDRGVRIPNFNDRFTGAAPDIGAHEAGQPSMEFGANAGRRRHSSLAVGPLWQDPTRRYRALKRSTATRSSRIPGRMNARRPGIKVAVHSLARQATAPGGRTGSASWRSAGHWRYPIRTR